jgi:WD40 repeat protein
MARRTALALILATLAGSPGAAAEPPAAPVSFRCRVAPILARRCLGCHNDRKAEGGLDLSSLARLRRGGEVAAETVVVAGDPAESYLIESVRGGAARRMPLKGPRLSDAEIATLENWVRQGARSDAPSEETPIASLVDPLQNLPAVRPKAARAEAVVAVALDPSGKRLAAAHARTVTLFDIASGKTGGDLGEHPGPVTALAFLPDGRTLVASGGRPGMFGAVTIWDLPNRSRRREVRGHSDAILAAAVSPDGKHLATGSYDRNVLVWDIARGEVVRTLKEHTDAVTGLAFTPDGKRLASCSWDRTVRLWDWDRSRRILTLSDATAELNALAFAPDGAHLLAAGADRSIRSWRIAGEVETPPHTVFAHGGAVVRLAVAPDGRTLASSGEDRRVRLWRLPGLEPIAEPAEQPDWAQGLAFSPDGHRLAIGRFDGSLDMVDVPSGKLVMAFRKSGGGEPPARDLLVRNASLNPPSPRGALRGRQTRLSLTGYGVGRAVSVVFREPGLTASIVPSARPDRDRVEVDLSVASDARVGLHAFTVLTPLGTPSYQTLAVTAAPEVVEGKSADPVTLPATLVGRIEKPGEVDRYKIRARAGESLVFEVTGQALGSTLEPSLSVVDAQGASVEPIEARRPGRDPAAIFRIPHDGLFTVQVADFNLGGSGNHFYRINAGALPTVRSVFPLGVTRGTKAWVALHGWNLGGAEKAVVAVGAEVQAGSMVPVPVAGSTERHFPVIGGPVVVAADGPQVVEEGRSEDREHIQEIAVPGGVSGRIEQDGDADRFAFRARKGERLILEVFGRRLGSPTDPVIEVLDEESRPVPRAVLRLLDQTEIAFRDHGSTGPGIRLTRWNTLAVNDHVLIGRELARILALPRNVDDDCMFWNEAGQRLGMLETTPEQHPIAQPIYRVEVLPPSAKVPPGEMSPVVLNYRNDDGGTAFAKDARLTFDPPRDGVFQVRVQDVRGLGGADFGYHLMIRRPRPAFSVALTTENPNIPRGGTVLVGVSVSRLDGFEQAITVRAEGLPPGVRCMPAVIEAGHLEGLLALSADACAPAFSPPEWTVTAEATGQSGETVRKQIDPGGPGGGWITVVAPPDLRVEGRPARLLLAPGQDVALKLRIERKPGWRGRVPIDVRNLPQGVRVLDIGLNGVLVTEKETERSVRLFVEPWVVPQVRPFYAVGRLESAGTESSSVPLELEVRPRAPIR